MQGYILLFRELIEKPIWHKSTAEQKSILITLLLMANHESKKWEWQGIKFDVKKGQFITSIDSIKKAAGKGITIQNIRTSLKRFQKLDFLTDEPTKTGRLITILNWDTYQVKKRKTNIATNKDLTKTPQRPNKDLTPNKNDKNDKNDKNKEIYAENVLLTHEEFEKLKIEFGEKGVKEKIENLNLYKGSKGIKYKSDYMTILSWDRRDKKEKQNKITNIPQQKNFKQRTYPPEFYKQFDEEL